MGYQVGIIDAAVEDISEEKVNAELLKEPDAPDELNIEICEAVAESKSWNKESDKRLRHGVNRNCRMLCAQCSELKRVKSVNGDQITLACRHQRNLLLPLELGHVSLEQMNTEIGKELFPASHDDELTSQKPWSEKRK